ncbi:MAG: hypothetical protein ACFE85_06290 [Candidatus Hodarchaeota archaeon]
MSQDLRDLIDQAEKEETDRAQLEKTIEQLKIEINRLNKKLREKKSEQELRIPPINVNLSEEIDTLKGVINSQKQELQRKESDIEDLQKKLEQTYLQLVDQKEKLEYSDKSKNALNKLMEDYSRLEKINEDLKNKVKNLENEKEKLTNNINTLKLEQISSSQLKPEFSNLKQKIQQLENERTRLIDNINNLKTKILKESELEQIVNTLKSKNIQLEEQTEELSNTIERLKREKFTIIKLENTVSELKSKLKKLEDENLRLKGKEIAIQEEKKIEPTYEIKSPIEQSKILEKIKSSIPPLKIQEKTKAKPKDLVLLKQVKNDSNVRSEEESRLNSYKVEEDTYDVDSTERKKICPRCGNKNLSQIREMDDKNNIILSYPKIFGKKYRCGQCGTEWR